MTNRYRFSRWMMAALIVALLAVACGAPAPTPVPSQPTQSVPPTAAPSQVPTREVPAPSGDASWDKVKAAGKLRVGTSADYPPFEYYSPDFKIDGFDIALINEVGKRLGVTVELNDFAFDGLGGALSLDQIDVAISGISVTPERQALADFTNVYYVGQDGVLAREDSQLANLSAAEALADKRVGVQRGSVYETYVQTNLIETGKMPAGNLLAYGDINQAVTDLAGKRIDLMWLDLLPAQMMANAQPVKVVGQGLNQQLYAIGARKGSATMIAKINEALTTMQNDGSLATLAQQYLKVKPTDIVKPPVVPTPVAPVPTAVPPACVNGMAWVSDLNLDDKNMTAPPVMQPGQGFTKSWRVKNSGTCAWSTGYKLAFAFGNSPAAQMGGQAVSVAQAVQPGQTYDFSINLIAPLQQGTYQGFWQMLNDKGAKFGETIWAGITVPGVVPPPQPTAQPPIPGINFTADRTTINAGDAVTFNWSVEGVKGVYFYRDGQDWRNHGVPGVSSSVEYPGQTVNYYLRVLYRDDTVQVRSILITVNAAPPSAPRIRYFNADPPTVFVGQCLNLSWQVEGAVSNVQLSWNRNVFWDNAPLSGSYQDCPTLVGIIDYRVEAFGPGGNARQKVSVNVQPQPPIPPTPIPDDVPTIYAFTVNPLQVRAGECVMLAWSTGGSTARVDLYQNGAPVQQGAPLQGNMQYCTTGPGSINFEVRAYNGSGQMVSATATLTVDMAPMPR